MGTVVALPLSRVLRLARVGPCPSSRVLVAQVETSACKPVMLGALLARSSSSQAVQARVLGVAPSLLVLARPTVVACYPWLQVLALTRVHLEVNFFCAVPLFRFHRRAAQHLAQSRPRVDPLSLVALVTSRLSRALRLAVQQVQWPSRPAAVMLQLGVPHR